MMLIETALRGVVVIEPKVFKDARGFFLESFNQERYMQYGINLPFVQDNISRSTRDVLRGLHFQLQQSQGKLVWVTRGEVFDVAVDVRVGSPTFGKSVSVILSEDNHKQFYIPPGFAHGFCVLSPEADFAYKCTDYYHPASEGGVLWNDPDLSIDWPISQPILSGKDQVYSRLKDLDAKQLPVYSE